MVLNENRILYTSEAFSVSTTLPFDPWNVTTYLNNSLDQERKASDWQCGAFLFIVNFIVAGSIALFGLAGNSLSILVLYQDKRNEVAAFLLLALAVVDNTILLLSLLVLSTIAGILPYMGSQMDYISKPIKPYIMVYVNPFAYMAQTAAIWLTVLIALNRYVAICRPFDANRLCTKKRAKIQVFAITMFSILYNVPRFFQYRVVYDTTDPHNPYPTVEPTVIGETSTFGMVYTNLLYSLLVLLIPMVILVAFNSRLILELRRMYRRRMTSGGSANDRLSGEENITFIMIVIIAIFIVCHTPDRIYQIVRHFGSREQAGCGGYLFYIAYICNLLIIISSSSNFIVYYLFRKRFRKILWQKLFGWLKKNKEKRRRESSIATEHVRLTDVRSNSNGGNGTIATESSKLMYLESDKNGLENGSTTMLPILISNKGNL